jgi:hypothetical protein
MLGCVTMDGAPSVLGSFVWGKWFTHCVWAQALLEVIGLMVQCGFCRQVLWSGPMKSCYVSTCHILLPTEQAWGLELNSLVDCFSKKVVRFSLLISPRWFNVLLFSPDCTWAILPTHRLEQQSTPRTPMRWRWNFPFIYLATAFVQEGCNLPTICTRLCGSPQNRLCGMLNWWSCNFSLWY